MLLEIKVISANDLPPVARMLRTYVVACLDHDNRSHTAVDRHGSTNPTWNHKFSFYVDYRFLNSKTSEIKFEIYNVAWLRDLPMGTTSLVIGTIFPALSPKNPTMRPFALRICRPTGHLQGILNVGVQLKDNLIGPRPPAVLESNADKVARKVELKNYNGDEYGNEHQNMASKECKTNKIIQKNDDIMISNETASFLESIATAYENKSLLSCVTEQKLKGESKGNQKEKNGGTGLKMHRLTSSEIAARDYWGGDIEDDYLGNSIFESWIMAAAAAAGDDREGETNKRLAWRTEDETIPVTGKDNGGRRGHRRCQSEGERGLFSFSAKLKLICGINSMEKKKRSSRKKKMSDDGVDDHTAALVSW